MKRITWEVQYTSPPKVTRYCKKCGRKTEYISSGMFRINAQRKYLDVWLIYKCTACDDTWNAAVHSRISPESLGEEELEQYHQNDESLAFRWAMDQEFLRKNGAEAGLPEYIIVGEKPSVNEAVILSIASDYSSAVKASAVLRRGLDLSSRELEGLLHSERLKVLDDRDLRKCKIGRGLTVSLEGGECCGKASAGTNGFVF